MLANHPEREQIRLENLLNALGNPLRLAVVRALSNGQERACGSLLQGQSKSTMTHHWRVLRDSGVIWQRPTPPTITAAPTLPRPPAVWRP